MGFKIFGKTANVRWELEIHLKEEMENDLEIGQEFTFIIVI